MGARFMLAGVAIISIAWVLHAALPVVQGPKPRMDDHRKSGPRSNGLLQIRGLSYSAIIDTKTVMTLTADRLSVQKKKLGFLRLGLIREAVVDNATISLYRPIPGPDGQGRPQAPATSLGGLSTLADCPTARLAPLTLTVHAKDMVPLRLTAARAEVKNKWREMVLEGEVVVTSGSQHLETDRLTINLMDGSLTCGPVRRPAGSGQEPGDVLSALAAALR